MEITVLCKVVDNFGDIGVCWRLCRRLIAINSEMMNCINLVVDDLNSFNKICSQVKAEQAFQKVDGINIYDWKNQDYCHEVFSVDDGKKLSVILECFQCGRPDWMEKILFEEKLLRTVQIIMIDYLTAEEYAENFHCLQSLTRSAKVQKVNFMPGFTKKTGGLIIDEQWKDIPDYNKNGPVLIFTYEKDFSGYLAGFYEWKKKLTDGRQSEKTKLLIAAGRGQTSFWESFKISKCHSFFDAEKLSFLNQDNWDSCMKNSSALIIRGEESLSRACLSGIPFIWHAYPQTEEYQMVKMEALLERMSRHFKSEDFKIVRNIWSLFNHDEKQSDADRKEKESHAMKDFMENLEKIRYGFVDFAMDLRKNGDLATNLMTFINKIDIIKK